jgi:hypothetical protein
MLIIFFGGLSRSGKSAFWPLFSSLENVDQMQNLPELDWFNTWYEARNIDEETFIECCKIKIDASNWFSYLGRYLNSNKNDRSNFVRLTSEEEYIKRISRNDTDDEFLKYQDHLSKKRFIPVYVTDLKLTHNQQKIMGYEVVHFHLIRNPYRMYNEWIKTKRIERSRQGSSRIMKPRVAFNADISVEDETATIIIEDYLKWKDEPNTIKFENLCQNPHEVMNKIARICDVNLLSFNKDKLKDANLPRDIVDEYSISLLNSANLSPEKIEILDKIQLEYISKI